MQDSYRLATASYAGQAGYGATQTKYPFAEIKFIRLIVWKEREMQIKPRAWRTVSSAPYDPEVWNWRTNLVVGIDYLAYSRAYLHKKNAFSYPLLLAAFHYGLDYVEDRDFKIHRIPIPDSPIYRELWSGNLGPVPPPG